MIDNKDKRVPGNALVGEPVREINRWKNRKNPSDDDVLHLFTALRVEKKRDDMRKNISTDLQTKGNFSPSRDEVIARSVPAKHFNKATHILPTKYDSSQRKASWVLAASTSASPTRMA